LSLEKRFYCNDKSLRLRKSRLIRYKTLLALFSIYRYQCLLEKFSGTIQNEFFEDLSLFTIGNGTKVYFCKSPQAAGVCPMSFDADIRLTKETKTSKLPSDFHTTKLAT